MDSEPVNPYPIDNDDVVATALMVKNNTIVTNLKLVLSPTCVMLVTIWTKQAVETSDAFDWHPHNKGTFC